MRNLLKTFVILFLMFLFAPTAGAQLLEWENQYGSGIAYSVQQTIDGGYIVAGSIYSEATSNDVGLLKVDANGELEWAKTYGGDLAETPYSVQQTFNSSGDPDGYVSFAAISNQGVYVIRTDMNGDILWGKTFSVSHPFYLLNSATRSVMGLQRQDGGFTIAVNGRDKYGPNGVYLFKIDSSGNFIAFSQVILDVQEGDERAESIQLTHDGGYILTGYKNFYAAGCTSQRDVWLVKVDSSFREEWETTFGDSCLGLGSDESSDWARSVRQTFDESGIPNGFILTGTTQPPPNNYNVVWVIRTGLDGALIWEQTYNAGMIGTGIVQTADGEYVVSAQDSRSGLILVKTDADGNFQWDVRFGRTYTAEGLRSFEQTADGGFVGAGYTEGQVWLIKISEEGELTPTGYDVLVTPKDSSSGESPVTLSFDYVRSAGTTHLNITDSAPAPPSGFKLGTPPTYYEINTTADYIGKITVCIDYSEISFNNESALKLRHYEDTDTWIDRTISHNEDTDEICAEVSSFSYFAIFEPINQPPVADAGSDLRVLVSKPATFDGSASHDPDGQIVAFDWDFGDGDTGTGAIASHAYAQAGNYTATLTVTDDGSLTNSDMALVVVLTPSEAIVDLESSIDGLVESGELTWQSAEGMKRKLGQAKDLLDGDNATAASRKLQDFIDQVNAQIRSGKLNESEGQALIDAAQDIIDVIGT